MRIEEVIALRLRSDAGIATRVGSRIYPDWGVMNIDEMAPRPFIVFTRISGGTVNHLGGPTEDTESRFQFDVIADNFTDGKGIASLVRTRLNGWRDVTINPNVQSCHLQNEFDTVEAPVSGTDRPIFRTTQDYLIWYYRGD